MKRQHCVLACTLLVVGFLALASFDATERDASSVESTLAEAPAKPAAKKAPAKPAAKKAPAAKPVPSKKAAAKAKKSKQQAAKMVSSTGAAAILAKAKARLVSEKMKATALKSKNKANADKLAKEKANKAKAVAKAAHKLAKQQKAQQMAQQKALQKAKKAAQQGVKAARRTAKRLARRAARVQHKVNQALAKQKIRETDAAIAAKQVAEARAEAGRQAAHNMHVAARATARAARIQQAVQKALKVASSTKDAAMQSEVKILKANLHKSMSRLHKALLVAQHASSLASKAAGGKQVPVPLTKKKLKKKSEELLSAGATAAEQDEYNAMQELEDEESKMDDITAHKTSLFTKNSSTKGKSTSDDHVGEGVTRNIQRDLDDMDQNLGLPATSPKHPVVMGKQTDAEEDLETSDKDPLDDFDKLDDDAEDLMIPNDDGDDTEDYM